MPVSGKIMINPCCCSCILFTDGFSGTIAPEWEQVAGTWTINGSSLLETTSTSAMIVHTTAVPANKGIIRAQLPIAADPATAGYRVIAYKDANNYAYIEIKQNATFSTQVDLQLGYFSSGVETVLGTSAGLAASFIGSIDEKTIIRLCWDGVRLVGGYQNSTLSGDYTAPDNLRPGFATPSSGTSWTFTNIELDYHNEERSNCPGCKTCWDICETWPDTIEVSIPASTFSTNALPSTRWVCNSNCESLNGQTFVLTKEVDGDIHNDSSPALGKTACPLYSYIEEDFCLIEQPGGGATYSATLHICAKFLASSGGAGTIQVNIRIFSECVNGPGGHGNQTVHQFTSASSLATWGPCSGEDYVTNPEINAGFGAGGTVTCHGTAPASGVAACAVNTNVLTIHL